MSAAVQEGHREPDRLGRPGDVQVSRKAPRRCNARGASAPRFVCYSRATHRAVREARDEVQLELGHLLAAGRGRQRHLARLTLVPALVWTLAHRARAWVIALALGSLVGVMRTTPQQVGGPARQRLRRVLPQHPAARPDVPLVLRAARAAAQGASATAIKQMPPPWASFVPAVLCLGFYTAARVAEQVRAGIQSLPRGQRMAGTALGLTLPQTYRYVLLPMAYRIIMPPLTSRVPEHHQEHVGRADDRPGRADRARRARCRSSRSRSSRRSPRRR